MHEMVDVALDLPGVKRLLVLNAASHGDTQDDVLKAFKTTEPPRVVLSKVDEAVKLGPALDALIRHQAVLRGVTNGQRVPEDWERADAAKLVSLSLQPGAPSAYDARPEDLNFFFAPASGASQYAQALHV
jgi:flagellar biosynthesis protein FlhF